MKYRSRYIQNKQFLRYTKTSQVWSFLYGVCMCVNMGFLSMLEQCESLNLTCRSDGGFHIALRCEWRCQVSCFPFSAYWERLQVPLWMTLNGAASYDMKPTTSDILADEIIILIIMNSDYKVMFFLKMNVTIEWQKHIRAHSPTH